jgi:hypothetical protein
MTVRGRVTKLSEPHCEQKFVANLPSSRPADDSRPPSIGTASTLKTRPVKG